MPEDLVASLEQIIARSALLKRTTDMYSWTRETQTLYVESILSTIRNPSDWKIEELLRTDREHELHSEIGRSGNAGTEDT